MTATGRRPLLYLVGSGGHPNYGDEMITASWLRYLAVVVPDADVWVDCPYPGNAAVLMDGLHPRARFVDTFWRLSWLAPIGEALDVSAWVQEAVRNPGLGARWAAGIEVAARADVVHVMGGGYVTDQWPRHVGVLAAAAAAVHRSGGRAAVTGAGLTPCARATGRLLTSLFDRFEVVDTRDEPSAELVGRPTSWSSDDLFLHPGLGVVDARYADAPGHVLCLQSDLFDDERIRDLAGFALATLREWKADPTDVAVVEGIPGHDRGVWSLMEQELPGARFYSFSEVWAGGLPVAAHQTWLSTRFHMHLVASAAGASGVAVTSGDEYYSTKHASLIARGSGWATAPDWAQLPDKPEGSFAPASVADLRASKQAVAEVIYGPWTTRSERSTRHEPTALASEDSPVEGPPADGAPARRRWLRRSSPAE